MKKKDLIEQIDELDIENRELKKTISVSFFMGILIGFVLGICFGVGVL
jgi:hypothetical protein